MPFGNQHDQQLARVLEYGPARLRKTWWALRACEAGFNVLMLDGEDKSGIVKNILPEYSRYIRIIRCKDHIQYSVFADVVLRLLKGQDVLWDDTDCRAPTFAQQPNPANNHFLLNATKLTPNDVLICDSWTALVASCSFGWMINNGVDVADFDRNDLGHDYYAFLKNRLDFALKAFTALPCHVIVIGHEKVIDITRPVPKSGRGGKEKIEQVPTGETRIAPISSSKGHSMEIARHFTDVLHYHVQGTHVYIDTQSKQGQDSGSMAVLGDFPWDQLQFGSLLAASNVPLPSTWAADMPGCVWMPAQPAVESAPQIEAQGTSEPGATAGVIQLQHAANPEAPVTLAGTTAVPLEAVE